MLYWYKSANTDVEGAPQKIFRGDFEAGEQLDTSIQGMTDAKMAYPLAYGYELVAAYAHVWHVCSRMLTYAHVCSHMQTYALRRPTPLRTGTS